MIVNFDDRSICVVAGELFGGSAVGGAERQIAMMSKGLSSRGWTVSSVIREVKGVDSSLIWEYGPTFEFLGKSGFRIEWIGRIRRAALRSGARLLCQRGVSVFTIAASQAARARRGAFVWFASSDADTDGFASRFRRSVSQRRSDGRRRSVRDLPGAAIEACIHVGARRAASHADLIIAQHEDQASAIVRAFRVPSERVTVVPSLVEPSFEVTGYSARESILWVGANKPVKRPDLFGEIQRLSSGEVPFRMVGKGFDDSSDVRNQVIHVGALSHQDLRCEYSSAILLVNTSDAEGFPNTFLESWQCGTPVVTIGLDPGGVIESNGLGYVADSVEGAATFISKALDGEVDLESMSRSCVEYVRTQHEPSRSLDLIANHLSQLSWSEQQ